MTHAFPIAMFVLLVSASQCRAAAPEDTVRGWLMLGGGVIPEYDGASTFVPVPALAGRVEWGRRYAQLSGLTARINVLGLEHVEVGPVLNVALGRKGAEGTPIGALEDLDSAVELGAFAAGVWRGLGVANTELWVALQATQDVSDVHGGWQAGTTVYASWAPSARWNLGAQLELNVASAAYGRTYFGVSAPAAAASGLPQTDLSAGLKDTAITLNVSRALDDRWWLTGVAAGRRLLADAAESPVVEEATGLSCALAISYTF